MPTTLFDAAAQAVEQHTNFDSLEARGTLRIALRESGLEVDSLTLPQLEVVFAKVMPEHLRKRGVTDETAVCGAVTAGLSASDHPDLKSSTDEIFGRLGGD